MPNIISDEILDDGAKATEPVQIRTNFGEMSVDAYRCVLQKGVGKIVYDPGQHSLDQRRTNVEMILTPLASSRFHDPIRREFLFESGEWTKIVRPSLQALNIDLRAINGRFCQVDMQPCGTYKDKNTGETKTRTTFKFVRIFATQQECEDAAAAFFHRDGSSQPSSSPAASAATTNGHHANGATGPAIDTTRQMAAKFLPGLWKASKEDPAEFVKLIKANKLTAAHFDESSEEVAKIILGG